MIKFLVVVKFEDVLKVDGWGFRYFVCWNFVNLIIFWLVIKI